MSDEFADISLVDIFRKEAESQAHLFEATVIELEQQPEDFSKIDVLMRAAHSLKGAAQIVGLKTVSHLAHLLEDCLVKVQAKKQTLSAEDVNVLLEAFDELASVRVLSVDEMFNWPSDRLADIQELEAKVKSIGSMPQEAQDVIEEGDFTYDPAMLTLFKGELEENLDILTKVFEGDDFKDSPIDDIWVRAAHSIKGSSAIVGFLGIRRLAQVMEAALSSAQEEGLVLGEVARDLRPAVVFLVSLLKVPVEDLVSVIIAQKNELLSLIQGIGDVSEEGDWIKKKSAVDSDKFSLGRLEEPSAASLKITAEYLNQLMAYSAELLVQMKRLEGFKDDLVQLKSSNSALHPTLQNALQVLGDSHSELSAKRTLMDLRGRIQDNIDSLWHQIDAFDAMNSRIILFAERMYQTASMCCMRPFSDGVSHLRRFVRDLSQRLNKQIEIKIYGTETPIDRHILEGLSIPVNHIVRNACDHGLESVEERIALGKPVHGTIEIRASHKSGFLIVEIKDDGKGICLESLKKRAVELKLYSQEDVVHLPDETVLNFIFAPGFTTTNWVSDISGRGVGLDVVHEWIETEGGVVRISTAQGKGTAFLLQLPITRSVVKGLLVAVGQYQYALPFSSIYRVLNVDKSSLVRRKNSYSFDLDNKTVSVLLAHQVLSIHETVSLERDTIPIVVFSDGSKLYGVAFDSLMGETNLVLRPLENRLGKIPCVSTTSTTEEGHPVLILDAEDMIEFMNKILARKMGRHRVVKPRAFHSKKNVKDVLLVDDSVSVRETQQRILIKAGYNVTLAKNGQEAWVELQNKQFDLVITDLDMPVLDGFNLIKLIRSNAIIEQLPVVIVTSKSKGRDFDISIESEHTYFYSKNNFVEKDFIALVKDSMTG